MLDVNEIQKILPHRYPFLLIDKVTQITPGEKIIAIKNVTIAEPVFQGHFPNHPIYPGVMILEGMAQAGGVLAFKSAPDEDYSNKVVYFMSIDKAKFRHPIRPGDVVEYHIGVLKHRGRVWALKGNAFVDGKLAAEAELQAMIMDR